MRNPTLDVYIADIATVADLLTKSSSVLDKVPTDGGWSAAQCLAHLADAEISLSLRVRMMFTSDGYKFLNWDEDAFAALNPKRSGLASVGVFTALRRANLELFEGLSEEQMSRTGIRTDGSEITVLAYIEYMNKHVTAHLEQAIRALAN
jgi:hypothetical protein